jgi:predicted Rossmann fold nucleotide-binding protein DprA/Smf involved in DNA uptake
MKVAVIGSRTLSAESHYQQLSQELDALAIAEAQAITLIISGGAAGVDTLAERYARERGIPTLVFLPDYQAHGRWSAPLRRNQLIVNEAEICLVLWDGRSKGTAHSVGLARKRGLRLIMVVPLS